MYPMLMPGWLHAGSFLDKHLRALKEILLALNVSNAHAWLAACWELSGQTFKGLKGDPASP